MTPSEWGPMHDAKMHDAKMHDANMHDAKMPDAKMHDAKMHDAKMHDAKMPRNHKLIFIQYTYARVWDHDYKPLSVPWNYLSVSFLNNYER